MLLQKKARLILEYIKVNESCEALKKIIVGLERPPLKYDTQFENNTFGHSSETQKETKAHCKLVRCWLVGKMESLNKTSCI